MQRSMCTYIVDDDSAVRDSIALWLGLRGGNRTRSFESAEAFLKEARPDMQGCALIDLQLGGMNGLELQRKLAEVGVVLPIIFITAHGDVASARAALKAGAFDFLEKPIDNDELARLVDSALRADAERVSRARRSRELHGRLSRLTQREREVMDLVVCGKHNREIAAQLGISARTVEVYKARLMDKLDVRRVPDLVRLVLADQEGLPLAP
jgi:RNA polymerase sigma factor (sigma-70 family)